MCSYDLLDECVEEDCDFNCTTNCTDPVADCPALDFLDNPFLEPVEVVTVLCFGGGACQYVVTFETSNSSIFTDAEEEKFCSAHIPLDYTGCLYMEGVVDAGDTFRCQYQLLCDLPAFDCPCEFHAACVTNLDCPELPAVADLGTEGMGRATRTFCMGSICRYESVYDFNNISNISSCNATETAQENFCAAQLADFDGMGLDLSTCLEPDAEPTSCLGDPYDCVGCQYQEVDQCEGCCNECNEVADCQNIAEIDGLVISSVDTIPLGTNCRDPFCTYEFFVGPVAFDCANSTNVFATCDSFILAPFDSCVPTTFYADCNSSSMGVSCFYKFQCDHDVLDDCDNCSSACSESTDCEILDESLYPDNSIVFNTATCTGAGCELFVGYAFESGVVEGNCSSLDTADRQYQCSQALLPAGLADCMHVVFVSCQAGGANTLPSNLQCRYVQECNATEIKTSCFGSCIGTNCTVGAGEPARRLALTPLQIARSSASRSRTPT